MLASTGVSEKYRQLIAQYNQNFSWTKPMSTTEEKS